MNEDKLTRIEWALIEAGRIIAEDTGFHQLDRMKAIEALASAAEQMEGISELAVQFIRDLTDQVEE